jgi:hypothetical protein
MNSNDTLDPIPTAGDPSADDAGDVWPTAGPAQGLRVRLPIAIACLAVVGLAGAAGGAALKKPASSTALQAGAVGGNRAAGANGAAGMNGGAGANGVAAPNGGAARFGGPGGGVVGTVTKVDGHTITVAQRDGTTATVVVPSEATVSKTVSGTLSDLTAGTSIAVRGTTTDGKTTAQSITVNPANGAGAGPGFGTPPAEPGTTSGN